MLSDGWGGAERLFVELCSGLAAEGHEVLAVCKPGFEQGRQLSSLHNLSYATIPARCNWDYLSVFQLKRLVSDFKADLLHAHLARASRMTGIVGRSLELPTISTTHNRIKKGWRDGYLGAWTLCLAGFREFDLHKRFTTMGVSKIKFYLSPDVSATEKITVVIVLLVCLIPVLLFLKRNLPLLFS